MADYSNPGGGADMYTDAAPKSDNPMPGEKEGKPEGEEGYEGETTLIPKSMGMGKDFKVGDEIVLKIVGEHDDQFEVTYAPEKPGDGEEGGEGGAPPEMPMPAGGGGGGGGMYD